ncbi:MAG: bacteriocin [Lachnospiraceae bacterium]|nr:bacteriocin [Lachnospiraceae bacterium]
MMDDKMVRELNDEELENVSGGLVMIRNTNNATTGQTALYDSNTQVNGGYAVMGDDTKANGILLDNRGNAVPGNNVAHTTKNNIRGLNLNNAQKA